MSTLSPSQQRAFDAATSGASLLITGSAGTGKSFLLKHIYSALTAQGKKVAITALTGCAAYLLTEDLGIKVNTIHSWVGFGYGEDTALSYIRAINQKHPLRQRWRATNTLIIDEISMMSAATFDKIEAIARGVRGKENADKPFGGLQVICVGDFFQLPPVVKSGAGAGAGAGKTAPLFAFESACWSSIIKHTIMLETIYRQRDPVFQKILEEARHGNLSDESVAALQERTTASWKKRTIKPTLIFTKRAVVDDINKRNIDVLKDPKYTYSVRTRIAPTNTIKGVQVLKQDEPIVKDAVAKLDNDANYIPSLTLCNKAQVMLIKNLDIKRGLVNGSRGVVTGFHPVEMSVTTVEEKVEEQVQVQEQEPKEENPSAVESTIVSAPPTRVDTKNGFTLTMRVRVTDPETGAQITKVITRTHVYFPLVLFVGQDEPILIEYNYWASTIEPSVSREQIPLALAWAVTTHKIQGATLDCALIDIGSDVFEYGQAYVALSRVKSLDTLFVHNLEPTCVRAHPIVKEYYAAISAVAPAEAAADPTTEPNAADDRPSTIPPKKFFSIFQKK
jgi:ATP-dependent DNA helicase PIF1